MTGQPQSAPRVRMRGVSKRFGGVAALDDAHFEVEAGEIHGLLGENGAGKSTLMKVLAGLVVPDAGEITLDGEPHRPAGPREAVTLGVAMIHQELQLVPELTVAENLLLGAEPSRAGWIDRAAVEATARALLHRVGADVDPSVRAGSLSIARQQLVEIAKALRSKARVLILDEPTAALSETEAARLFDVMRDLAAAGVALIYISHRMPELRAITSRVTVLRDGATHGTYATPAASDDALLAAMAGATGRQAAGTSGAHPDGASGRARSPGAAHIGGRAPPRLEVRGLRAAGWGPVSLSLAAGEVLGIGGLVGAGRSRLLRLLFGVEPREGGEVLLDGTPVPASGPRGTVAAGLAFVTEDRKTLGLLTHRDVRENLSIASLERAASVPGVLQLAKEDALVRGAMADLRIKAASPDVPVAALSGGNQQKVILGRWLLREPRVLLLDEPTRGIDVAAKDEFYALIRRTAANGAGVLLVSSDTDELLELADRIIVLREGRIAGEVASASTDREALVRLAITGGMASTGTDRARG